MLRAEEQIFKKHLEKLARGVNHVFTLVPRKKDQDVNTFLFKKSLRNLKAHLCITPVIRASFTVFSNYFFEKTAELCSGKGDALSLPLAAIP